MTTPEHGQKATVWVTKYALTRGIFERTGEIIRYSPTSPIMIRLDPEGDEVHQWYLPEKDFCFTREEAIEVAEAMRLKRIANLKKQILKLESKVFR